MVGALALVGAASQASGATAAGAAPRSGVPARCSTSFNPYQAPTSLLHSCGDRILRLKHLTALAGGGDAYDYGDYTVLVPPRHFNPLKASDRQLREYGMPTQKQIGRRWRVLMRHYRYAKAPTPFLVENPHVRAPAPRPTAVRRPQACLPPSCSTNWAGYYITSPTPLGEVTATWTEPHFVAKTVRATSSRNGWGLAERARQLTLARTARSSTFPGSPHIRASSRQSTTIAALRLLQVSIQQLEIASTRARSGTARAASSLTL
jgi:hypothetical protein